MPGEVEAEEDDVVDDGEEIDDQGDRYRLSALALGQAPGETEEEHQVCNAITKSLWEKTNCK